uniref:Uncharacterized protein n=1 Tax=Rhizophora mucronata TaxID=61149 RepID=A0A2P2NMI0_RHIMU
MAAKSALALVASSPEVEATSKEKYPKKNKLKKHVQVQLLYEKHLPVENHRNDEELARRLHRVMNSSSRNSKNSSTSGLKGNRIKPGCQKTGVSNGGVALGGNPHSVGNGHATVGDLDSEGSIPELHTSVEDGKASGYENSSQLRMDNGGAESSHSRERWEIQGQGVKREED